jgi:hypothetical protein
MAGGLIHLVYIGNQDKVLTQLPEITFFKTAYCKHSSFGIQDHYLQSETDTKFGESTSFKLRAYGDLLFRPYLKITLPEITASYKTDISQYITSFDNNNNIKNTNNNIVLSKLGAILHNYNVDKIPIFLNNNTTLMYNYENCMHGKPDYNFSENTTFQSLVPSEPVTSYDYNSKYNLLTEPSTIVNRNIYYSSYNINYLTTELNKIQFNNDIIITGDNYLELFREYLFNYITKIDEQKFIYSLLSNKHLYTYDLSKKNIEVTVTNELIYSLDYVYSNIKYLYIYESNGVSKSLKSIFYVKDYVYSGFNYNNQITAVNNLYTYLDNVIQDSKVLYISNGYNTNKSFNIEQILSIDSSGNSYDISTNIDKDSNKLYMIYLDQEQEQDLDISNIYHDIYFNKKTNDYESYNIYNNYELKLPICYVKYNSETDLFDKIELSTTISKSDFIYLYKDVIIFDKKTQQYNYVLINNNMYEFTNDTLETQYTNNLYIKNKVEIIDGTISYNDKISFLLNSDDTLKFINNYTSEEYATQNYIIPYTILLDNNDDMRMVPIVSVFNNTLNLDTYNDTYYNTGKLQEFNLTEEKKTSVVYRNVSNTMKLNMLYIKNLFKYMLNSLIYYKFYNKYTHTATNTTINLNPEFNTNIYTYLFESEGINGERNFYNMLQEIIVTEFDVLIDNNEVSYAKMIREILSLKKPEKFISNINNVINNDAYLYIVGAESVTYYNTDNDINQSKIYFSINTNYIGYDILSDLSENFNFILSEDDTYFYVPDMLYNESTIDGSKNLLLTPLNGNANKQFYIFNALINLVADDNDVYYLRKFYILPNNADISNVTMSDYSFLIDRTTQNVFTFYDNIVNINTDHLSSIQHNNTTYVANYVIDIGYILYHYAVFLYEDVRDRVINIYSTNNFTKYNDINMYNNLRHIKQLIYKRSKNGNNSNIIDLTDIAQNSTYYLDCNICYTDHMDHVMINNTLKSNIFTYIGKIIKPIIKLLLQDKKSYFNFYTKSYNFYFTSDISNSLDINLDNIDDIKLLHWYYHYINSIKSDINNYIINENSIDMLTNITIDQILSLNTFFDTSTNIFNPDYKGTTFSLLESDLDYIVLINKHILDIIDHVKVSIKKRKVLLLDGTIVIYAETIETRIFTMIYLNTLNLRELFIDVMDIYTLNVFDNYTYKDIIPFFYNIKKQYQNMHVSLHDKISNHGSFSSSYISQILQLLNFDINDYLHQMDWFKTNSNYTLDNDILQYKTNTATIISDESYYKSVLINDSTDIDNFYSYMAAENIENDDIFTENSYLLNIKYEVIEDIVNEFNQYFNYEYLFYSDYRIIYALYFHYYDTYSFYINDISYNLTFNLSDNASNENIITDLSTSEIYNYRNLSFGNDEEIAYTIANNKLYDVSENTYINYIHRYINGENEIKKYDNEYIYQVINNNIVDISENVTYTITNNIIYDLSNNIIGQYIEDIYTINLIDYKYEIIDTKVQALFANYVTIPIVDNKIIINEISYNLLKNIFHNANFEIIFKFIIPNIDIKTTFPTFQVIHDGYYIDVKPLTLKPFSNTHSATIDISPVFINTFSAENMQKSIQYLQQEVHNSISDISNNTSTFNVNNIDKLLSNILSNSILPQQNYINDTILCANFNNWKDNGNSIDSILTWIIIHNQNNVNEIKIFNVTDQIILKIDETIAMNNKEYYFVVERYSYIPLQINDTIYKSTDEIINISNKFSSTLSFMLHQSKQIKKLDSSYIDILSTLRYKTKLVKNKIIDTIFEDISNGEMSDFYNENVHFDIIANDVSWDICDNNIGENSVFIRNSILIDNSDNINMKCMEYGSFILKYIDKLYYLEDISNNLYLISIVHDISSTISYNNCIFLYDDNNVYINVEESIFPKTLNIFEGKLLRLDTMENGFNIDTSGNLIYDFKYDIYTDVLLKSVNNTEIKDISCDIYTSLDDLSDNQLINDDDRNIWINNTIEDTSNTYLVTDTSENLRHNYILISNDISQFLGYVTYSYVNIDNKTLLKIFMIDDFQHDILKSYTIKIKIKDIINHISYDRLWYKTVFYYWETFKKSLNQIYKLISHFDDTNFKNKKFSTNSYIEHIFNDIDIRESNLLDLHLDHFTKSISYNVTALDKYETIKTLHNVMSNTWLQHLKNIKKLEYFISRDPIAKCSWIDYIGHYICNTVNFKIDGNIIEEINDQIIHIYNIRESNDGTLDNLYRMIGHNSHLQIPNNKCEKHIIYVPLPMCFQHNVKALPIIALTNSDLTMDVNLKDLSKLVKSKYDIRIKQNCKVKVEINASYVFLDLKMREKFARSRHEYLYEIKRCYKYTIGDFKNELKLDYVNPCKEMLWFYVSESVKESNDLWNYTGSPYKLYNPDLPYDNDYTTNDDVRQYIMKMLLVKEKYYNLDLTVARLTVEALNSSEIFQLCNYIRQRKTNSNPFTLSALNYNGHNRFCMDGIQSSMLEALLHYNDSTLPGLNMKAWSRDPKGILHMGYNNYTLCHDMRLQYELNKTDIDGDINVITNSYNLLRIASGIGCAMW